MSTCPECRAPVGDNSTSCPACGAELAQNHAAPPDEDALDFVVTEAHDGNHELVGGLNPVEPMPDSGEPTATDRAQNEIEPLAVSSFGPIGESAPPPPPPAQPPDSLPLGQSALPPQMTPAQPSTGVKKLSPDQVESIRKQMYGSTGDFPPETDNAPPSKESGKAPTSAATSNSSHETPGFKNTTIVPPRKDNTEKRETIHRKTAAEIPDGPKPKMAGRTRGIAYFAKHLIQITGEQELCDGDELVVNNRCYILKKKKINSKTLAIIITPLAAVLLFLLGAMLTSDSSGGRGQIVGLVLDSEGQPYKAGATIRFPGLNDSYETNAQGFFKTDALDRGSYKLEYLIKGKLIRTDFATVVGGEITTLVVSPESSRSAKNLAQTKAPAKSNPPPSRKLATAAKPTAKAASATGRKSRKPSSRSTSKPARKKAVTAKLTLAANVENSRLSIDGSVLGAGNLTYSKLKPGKHRYSVSADGYATKTGTVFLSAGKSSRLTVTLKPLTQAKKKESFLEDDYYYSGRQALQQGKYDQAITDLTEAIKIKPGYTKAYLARAEAYDHNGEKPQASEDYVRAAEQLRVKKDPGNAMTAYSKAISANSKNINAFLGRGYLFLAKGEEIAATADFETAVDLDRRSFEAYMGLGQARFAQGYYKKATKHFKDAKALKSQDPRVYQYLMLCYMARDDIKKVKKTYERFSKVAGDRAMRSFNSDKRFTAVRRVVGK